MFISNFKILHNTFDIETITSSHKPTLFTPPTYHTCQSYVKKINKDELRHKPGISWGHDKTWTCVTHGLLM